MLQHVVKKGVLKYTKNLSFWGVLKCIITKCWRKRGIKINEKKNSKFNHKLCQFHLFTSSYTFFSSSSSSLNIQRWMWWEKLNFVFTTTWEIERGKKKFLQIVFNVAVVWKWHMDVLSVSQHVNVSKTVEEIIRHISEIAKYISKTKIYSNDEDCESNKFLDMLLTCHTPSRAVGEKFVKQ